MMNNVMSFVRPFIYDIHVAWNPVVSIYLFSSTINNIKKTYLRFLLFLHPIIFLVSLYLANSYWLSIINTFTVKNIHPCWNLCILTSLNHIDALWEITVHKYEKPELYKYCQNIQLKSSLFSVVLNKKVCKIVLRKQF
jgi:hypothetical protein